MSKLNLRGLPAPVDKIVGEFIHKIDEVLPDFLVGFYIIGSIPLLDFFPQKSDIDFVAVCKKVAGADIYHSLKEIHKCFSHNYPKPDLSGVYIQDTNLVNGNYRKWEVLTYHERKMRYGPLDMAPVTLFELQHYCITVVGRPANGWPSIIGDNTLREFVHVNMEEYWKGWVKKHTSLFRCRILLWLFPRFTEWVVLGLARQLYTLQTGKIASKTEAGLYALACLPVEYHSIIRQAIEIRANEASYPILRTYVIKPSMDRLIWTLEYADYIITLLLSKKQ